ncbi:MAG: hypothetical protein B7733_07525 [Myxococcales bacterium FL481]|nr:MAG: hypothetical protein B7733_07525 [Myxococcales bacterium FL481]
MPILGEACLEGGKCCENTYCTAYVCSEFLPEHPDPNGEVYVPDEGDNDEGNDVLPHADGVEITDIAVNQGVAAPVYASGSWIDASSRSVDIIRGRGALVRAFWDASGDSHEVVARLILSGAVDHVYTSTKTVVGTSHVLDPDSTFNFVLPEEHVVPGVKMQIDLREKDEDVEGAGDPAVWPDDPGALGVADDAMQLRITIVPVDNPECEDGIPEIDPDKTEDGKLHFEKLHRMLYSFYPTNDFTLEVSEPLTWSVTDDWYPLLYELDDMQGSDETNYYFAYADGCGNSVGGDGGMALSDLHISAGIWWYEHNVLWGDDYRYAWGVATHEIGHTLGRPHSPGCNAGGPDAGYPNPGGEIESYQWGYGVLDGFLTAQNEDWFDYMSYCDPYQWTSEYVWVRVANRVETHARGGVVDDVSISEAEFKERQRLQRLPTQLVRVERTDGTERWDVAGGGYFAEQSNAPDTVTVRLRDGRERTLPGAHRHLDNGDTMTVYRLPAVLDEVVDLRYSDGRRAESSVDLHAIHTPGHRNAPADR